MAAETDTQALLLPDILFSIFPHVDFYSLLRCQRVCKTWKSVISRSRSARQTLFLEADSSPFALFQAAEEHDLASHAAAAWQEPSQRIPARAEFRAMFNPWIYTHGCAPISVNTQAQDGFEGFLRRASYCPVWRFTDRVSAGRLDFCFTPAELVRFVRPRGASWEAMFLTQPPVRRVLVAVQGGYMADENFDVEREGGVKIGDVVSVIRGAKSVAVMKKRRGGKDYTTVKLSFDEHFTGVRFMKMMQLVKDEYGNVNAREA
ncbi:hypothetical protein N0V86_004718 [Didymella sp. IMI 355093]|nr:hypothetical protein N0V86_004718 [Didymella sp. IMI 355093]